MVERYVVLLRGINVGRAKRVAMADLRTLVADLGYGDVRTLLNSGNVVLSASRADARRAGSRIEAALVERLGVAARVTILAAAELASAVDAHPLRHVATDPSRLLVTVPRSATDTMRLAPLAREDWAPEALAVGARVAYLWCPAGILASRLPVAVERLLGDASTSRNWATVLKLCALAAETG